MTAASDLAVGTRLAAAVHRHSPVPLHHQIKVAVLQGVEQGWLPPGAQLPRERELAEALGVSLAPVRQAMADLTKEGYVDRTRGKGTFVRDRKLVEKIQILGSFHDSVRRQGLNSTVQVLSSEFVTPPHEVATALALRGKEAWCLRRHHASLPRSASAVATSCGGVTNSLLSTWTVEFRPCRRTESWKLPRSWIFSTSLRSRTNVPLPLVRST